MIRKQEMNHSIQTSRFSIAARLRSFSYAGKGIAFMLKTQHNAWLHLLAAAAVTVAGIALDVSAADWRWLVAAITLVWAAEAVNTAIEHVCNVVSPRFHPSVEKAKDVGAAAVLICAVGAALVGVLTLWPYL